MSFAETMHRRGSSSYFLQIFLGAFIFGHWAFALDPQLCRLSLRKMNPTELVDIRRVIAMAEKHSSDSPFVSEWLNTLKFRADTNSRKSKNPVGRFTQTVRSLFTGNRMRMDMANGSISKESLDWALRQMEEISALIALGAPAEKVKEMKELRYQVDELGKRTSFDPYLYIEVMNRVALFKVMAEHSKVWASKGHAHFDIGEPKPSNKSMGVQDFLQVNATVLVIPTTRKVGFAEIIETFPYPIHLVGLIDKPLHVDGIERNYEDFFWHDLNHMMRAHTSLEVDQEVYRSLGARLQFHERYKKQLSVLASPRNKLLAKALWFTVFHEQEHMDITRQYNADFAREALIKKYTRYPDGVEETFEQMFLNRLVNDTDFGQAFKTPPTREEVLATIEWAKPLTVP